MSSTLAALRLLRLGDRVETPDGLAGFIVVNFETGDADPAYGLDGWGDDGGLLVLTDGAGLVRYSGYCFQQDG